MTTCVQSAMVGEMPAASATARNVPSSATRAASRSTASALVMSTAIDSTRTCGPPACNCAAASDERGLVAVDEEHDIDDVDESSRA